MTLKIRLTLAFSMLAMLIVALTVSNFITVRHAREFSQMLVNAHIAPMRDLKVLADEYAVAIVDNVHKIRSGAVDWDAAATVMASAEASIARSWAQVAQHGAPPDEVPFLDAITASMEQAKPAIVELRTILTSRNATALVDFAEKRLYLAIDPISADIAAYALHLEQAAIADVAEEARLHDLSSLIMWAVAAVATIVIGYGAYVVVFSVAGRLRKMELALSRISAGDTAVQIPFVDRNDEIGHIAKSAEVFRSNGERLNRVTSEQLDDRQAQELRRRAMMETLAASFGSVIAAARDGDLAPRIAQDFNDPELIELAGGVNMLLERVAQGLTASGIVLSAMAQADLTKTAVGDFKGAFGKLQTDTNMVVDRLSDVISEVRIAASALRSATGEILAGSNDLAVRTSKQAATIEATSAAIEQLSTTVSENSRVSQQAAVEAELAAKRAQEGVGAMEKANLAMVRINRSSGEISNVIGLIDDIAFQTNLLALNASVEAARAGDAGNGFAVVAQEVRRLAQSAAKSSAQVKLLIEQSNSDVMEGEGLVSSAAASVQAMLDVVRRNATAMQSIASASKDQASAIGTVSGAVRQLDEMTQHNAALVEQTNAAIEQTESLAAGLDAMIDRFKLKQIVAGGSGLRVISSTGYKLP